MVSEKGYVLSPLPARDGCIGGCLPSYSRHPVNPVINIKRGGFRVSDFDSSAGRILPGQAWHWRNALRASAGGAVRQGTERTLERVRYRHPDRDKKSGVPADFDPHPRSMTPSFDILCSMNLRGLRATLPTNLGPL